MSDIQQKEWLRYNLCYLKTCSCPRSSFAIRSQGSFVPRNELQVGIVWFLFGSFMIRMQPLSSILFPQLTTLFECQLKGKMKRIFRTVVQNKKNKKVDFLFELYYRKIKSAIFSLPNIISMNWIFDSTKTEFKKSL
jgi:hypothetical protein